MYFKHGSVSSDNPIHPMTVEAIATVARIHSILFGSSLVVTDLNNREPHGPDSFHPEGLAFDVRSRHLTGPQEERFVDECLDHLLGWEIVVELTHIHFEYDPRHLSSRPRPWRPLPAGAR